MRNKKIDGPQQEALLQQINLADEKFTCVIQLTAAIFRLGLFLSHEESFVADLINSGFMWRALQFLQFSTQRELL